MSITSEKTFEDAIIQVLVDTGEYTQGSAGEYSPELGFFKYDILDFLKATQPKRWKKLEAIHGENVENRVLQRLYKELDLRSSLDVIRKGFTDYGVRLQMAFPKPASTLNPEALAVYKKNSLKVYRQVYFSAKNKYSVDLVLSLNGLPVATLELKNHFTGQTVANAKRQYAQTRDEKELLFAFKKRTLVHFAVDSDEVYMTTRLQGDKTYWLPFNKGYRKGKGNPPNGQNYRTAYLWEEIFQKDSWLEIIQKFIHLQIEEVEIEGRTFKKEKLIFPRYHQLDAVRKMRADVLESGVGRDYLVQHSAGSGKSNSIAWLAYQLSSLHDATNQRLFDSVIVITDRRILDQQLQNTIYQFEHKQGVVQKIDKDSSQLAAALGYGTNIIITTLQKFPYVVDKVGEMPERTYAVIIDEAHSSQGGIASKKLKEVLSSKSLEEAERDELEQEEEDIIQQQIERSAASRGKQNNLSFFAFTATPKYKTLEIFGHKDQAGKPQPFHLYSMRQAIEEGFILNVLENYTTYDLYFKLSKAIVEDPKMNKKKAAIAIGRFVSLHPYNVAQKTEIIIEHFRQVVSKKIGGKAKAMVVTSSRLHAVRYFDQFQRYIQEKNYENEIKVLVAFSGKVKKDKTDLEGVSESQLTGYAEKQLPKMFEKDEYKILIVADKYQTGFDQPLLHTMYVDKKLSGVRAVQTLSRLNRICPGKTDTFVIDFANSRESILESFQPYYELTTTTEETDINHLYDLKNRLDTFQVYWQEEIDELAEVYFDPRTKLHLEREQKRLYGFTGKAVDRYKSLLEDKQDEFKKGLRTWTNLYSFLAQIMPFTDIELEKFFAYAKLLQKRLPKRNLSESLQIDDEVALEYYRLQKMKEGAINLINGETGELSGTGEAGLKRPKGEEVLLSELITVLNERFGTEFDEADRLFFEQIEAEMEQDETLQTQAKVNKMDTFKYAFEDVFLTKLIERMDQNQEIFEKILEDNDFGALVKEMMMQRLYKKMNEEDKT